MSGYTYDKKIYLWKDRTCLSRDMTTTYTTVKQLTKRWKDTDIIYICTTSSCWSTYLITSQNWISIVVGCSTQQNLRPRNKWQKPGDIHSRTRDDRWLDGNVLLPPKHWCVRAERPGVELLYYWCWAFELMDNNHGNIPLLKWQ